MKDKLAMAHELSLSSNNEFICIEKENQMPALTLIVQRSHHTKLLPVVMSGLVLCYPNARRRVRH